VLANSTSIGMSPNADESPVPARALMGISLVFDAVYTPVDTKLLQDARAQGCQVREVDWRASAAQSLCC